MIKSQMSGYFEMQYSLKSYLVICLFFNAGNMKIMKHKIKFSLFWFML